jgi:hypothetical protein
MSDQRPHVAEPFERRDFGDDERPGQRARPIRAGQRLTPAQRNEANVPCGGTSFKLAAIRSWGTAPGIDGAISSTPASQSPSMARDIDAVPCAFSQFGMVYRKGELSPAGIDRGWPHQVALPAAVLLNGGYKDVHKFCDDLSLCPRGHAVFHEGQWWNVHCFADAEHAEKFMRQSAQKAARGAGQAPSSRRELLVVEQQHPQPVHAVRRLLADAHGESVTRRLASGLDAIRRREVRSEAEGKGEQLGAVEKMSDVSIG